MTRYASLFIIGLATLTTACNTVKHTDAKVQAHQRWNHVRGRVKHQLAGQQYQAGLFEDAAQTLAESIALDPTEPGAYALLAKANLELGRPATAQQVLDEAKREALSSPDLIYLQGVLLEQRGKLEAAAAAYADARRLDPANVDYLVAQAECLVSLDRPGAAMQLLEDNPDRIDDDGTVSALAAHITALIGDTERACERYRQALVTHADSRLMAQGLGRLLARSRRYREALAVLVPLMETDNDTEVGGAVRRTMASCHLALGDPASAKKVLAPYARSNPEDTLAQLLLAKAAVATDDVLTALRALDLVEQREPNRPELWLVRAAVQWKRDNLIAAAADLYDVLQNNPNDVEAHCLLAEVLEARHQIDTARTHFQRALEIDPDSAWAAAGLKALGRAQAPPAPTEPTPRLTSVNVGMNAPDSRP